MLRVRGKWAHKVFEMPLTLMLKKMQEIPIKK